MYTLARNTDPETSHLAAAQVQSSGLNKRQAAQVLDAVRAHPGCTSFELAHHMGIERAITGRRLPELAKDGAVIRCQPKRCSVSGKLAITWRLPVAQLELIA